VIGKTISHFRILAKLGEGGMGVVYKAEDERLGRPVALKVLRGGLGGGEEGRLRLIREARTAAAISHPHIAAIYEIDEADGVIFIAMEYVEGKTLRSMLMGRPMEIRQALKIAAGIAEGLARAHRGRIVHRDLKPDNVMIASDGQVKVLDFGLAKLQRDRSELDASELSKLDTISADLTREGRIVGTVAYMSPEQARGQSFDARSDLFSFGIVLYEMATGRAPFKGSTELDTLTAIIRERTIPAVDLNPEVPPELERILEKCLEKDPADRYQDTGDLVVDLRRLIRSTDPPQQPYTETAAPERIRPPRRLAPRAVFRLSVVSVLVAALGLGWFAWRRHLSMRASAPAKLELRQLTAFPVGNALWSAAISPDGRYLAYMDETGLHLHSIDTGETRQLPLAPPETRGIDFISWFPDGTRLLLTDSSGPKGILISYSIMTGTERRLRGGATDDGFGAVSPDGSLIAFTDFDFSGIWIMTASGDDVRQIVRAGPGESVGPSVWAPDGRRLAYVSGVKGEPYGRAIKSVDTQGQGTTVIAQARIDPWLLRLCWVNGRVLYAAADPEGPSEQSQHSEYAIWQARLDDRSGRPEGPPRNITSLPGFDLGQLSAAQDGGRLAFIARRFQTDAYVGRLEDGGTRLEALRRLTLDDRNDRPLGWMPDGRSILFSSDRNGTEDLFRQEVEGRTAEVVYASPDNDWRAVLTPDCSSLLVWQWHAGDSEVGGYRYKLTRVPLSGGPPHLLLATAVGPGEDYRSRCSRSRCVLGERRPSELVFFALDPEKGKGPEICRLGTGPTSVSWDVSPDGARIAVVEYDGRLRIISVPDGTVRATALSAKGWGRFQSVAWSHDSASLFVSGWSGDNAGILRVDLQGKAIVLWRHRGYAANPVPSPDGRFLAVHAASSEANVWMIEDF
jgi:Tol biopolymer transport system component/predicted Ser/Thr protein kinase